MPLVRDASAVLREPNFGRLYATRLTSQGADGIFQAGLASFVLFSPDRRGSAGAAAAAFATLLLPYSIVGPFAGVFIDRWRRQRILVVSNVVRAGLVLVVAALVARGSTGPSLYASALAVLSVNRFFLSALSAALPHVVRPSRLVMGNSVTTTSGALCTATGFGLALAVRSVVGKGDHGSSVIMLFAGGVYLVSSVVARSMDRELLGPAADVSRPETREALRRVFRGVTDGARHVLQRRRTAEALAAIAAHRFFYGISTIATLLLFNERSGLFRTGLEGFGLVGAASAVGALAGAVIAPEATRRVSTQGSIAWLFALAAVVEVGLGFPYTVPAFVAAAFFLGIVAQGSKICVDTILQTTVEDAYRGRVFSFYDILFNVSFVSAAVVAAATLPASGKSYAVLAFIATGYAATALVYALVSRREHPPAPADAGGSSPGQRGARGAGRLAEAGDDRAARGG